MQGLRKLLKGALAVAVAILLQQCDLHGNRFYSLSVVGRLWQAVAEIHYFPYLQQLTTATKQFAQHNHSYIPPMK